ncbi:zinc finger protein [Sesbania bispinosa]|nr:zinc finger protein [Sesbania bispinosa]
MARSCYRDSLNITKDFAQFVSVPIIETLSHDVKVILVDLHVQDEIPKTMP